MNNGRTCVRIKITGKVQGVWFRAYTQEKATELGLTGWVKNEPDGSVLAEAMGPSKQVTQFIEWCRTGSPLSRVNNVVSDPVECQDHKNFTIRR